MKNIDKDINLLSDITNVDQNLLGSDFNFDEEFANIEMQGPKDKIANFLRLFIAPRSTKLKNKLASEIGKEGEQVTAEELGITIPPMIIKGTTSIEFKILNVNDENGVIKVKIILSINEEKGESTFEIKGFKKQSKEKELILRKIAEAIQTNQNTTITNLLPTEIGEVNKTTKPQSLGIKDLPVDKKGVVIDYQIVKHNNEAGTITVKVILTLKGVKDSWIKLITVSGYKTLATKYQEDVDKINEKFPASVATTLSTVIPHWSAKEIVTAKEIGITQPTLDGEIITYAIESNDKNTGIIVVNVKIEKKGKTASKQIQVTNFRTLAMQYKIDVKKIADNFYTEQATTKRTTLPSWNVKDNPTITDLGIKQPALLADETVTFSVKSNNETTGIVEVEAKISKHGQEEKITIKITDFKTRESQNADDVTSVIEKFTKTQTNEEFKKIFPNWKRLKSIEPNKDIKITTPTITENFVEEIKYQIAQINQENGEVEVLVKITKGQVSKQTTITLKTFKTFQKHFEEEIARFKNLITNQKSLLVTKLVSSIISTVSDQTLTASELGIKELKYEELNGSQISYKITSSDDAAGTANVEVNVKKPLRIDLDGDESDMSDQEESFNIVVSNFKSLAKQDQDEALEFVKQISSEQTTSHTTLFPDWKKDDLLNAKTLGINDISIAKNASLTFKVVSNNHTLGNVVVQITYTKNQQPSSKIIVISGYKTQATKDTEDVTAITTKISDSYSTTATTIFPQWSNKTMVLPSEIGITEITVAAGMIVSYQIFEVNQGDGSIVVNVTVKKSAAISSKKITVTGFLNYSQFLDKKIERFKKIFGTPITTLNDKKVSELINENASLSATILGIKDILTEDLEGIILSYDYSTYNDEEGQITLEIDASMEYRIDLDENTSEKIPYSLSFLITVKGFKK